jgi:hypothetical protein
MLLYLGSGPALAKHRRAQRVQGLVECAGACGAASHRFAGRLERGADGPSRGELARGLESARDCLELCSLAAALAGRGSELAALALAPCAEACRRCAEACDALSPGDMEADCASLCRRAEAICRRWAGS